MERNIRKLFPLVIIFLAQNSFSQDVPPIPPTETKSGSAAFLFGISGLSPFGLNAFPIKTFDTTAVTALGSGNGTVYAGGGKLYVADFLALRGLAGISSSSKGDENSADGKTTTFLWGLSGGIEMHTLPISSLSPYFGGQISFAGATIHNTISQSDQETVTKKFSGNQFSISILWGFDWFFTYGIAIGAEYLYGYSHSSSTSVINGTSSDGPSPSILALGFGNLHLSVHF